MAEYCPDLSAKAVNTRLKESLEALRLAEKNAVLWFAEVMQRKLYLELGYSSIQQYAELELGFKKVRTSQFIRLSQALRELPLLMKSVARGEVSWTKAREVSGVATRKTESAWIAEARKSTSRELERKVAIIRQQAKAVRSGAIVQTEMGTPGPQAGMLAPRTPASNQSPRPGGESREGRATGTENVVRPKLDPLAESLVGSLTGLQVEPLQGSLAEEVPCGLHYRLSPTQFARYEALVEKLRKLGVTGSREEFLLECMEIAFEVKAANQTATRRRGDPEEWEGEGKTGFTEFPRGNSQNPQGKGGKPARPARTPYGVTAWMCEGCGTGTVETSRGPMKLAPSTLKSILCDAMVRKRGKQNRSVLPERVRRQVMGRDRMRCRGAGCNRTRFLAVHHLVPRKAGGTHDPDNLVTLCEGCHQAAHRQSGPPPLCRVKETRETDKVSEHAHGYGVRETLRADRVGESGCGYTAGDGVRGPTTSRYLSAAVEQFLMERRVE